MKQRSCKTKLGLYSFTNTFEKIIVKIGKLPRDPSNNMKMVFMEEKVYLAIVQLRVHSMIAIGDHKGIGNILDRVTNPESQASPKF